MTWIKDIVQGLIEIYETRNVYELVDLLNIGLIKRDLPTGIKGKFFRDLFDNEFIFVSNELSPQEEIQVIAHELGHAILHTELTASYYTENHLLNKDQIEYQANKFAAELLMPNDVDFSIYDSMTIKELSCLFEVSEKLIELKFKEDTIS
ncbi:ImmA/IrrE family metallo-endopeptidase [Tissierella praeacuta]|uniref:ImmA/IrrE family metallo-endopeptidase n=1 Tax=Tissierella praeacuta TaxID=43131 RepID=UPI002897E576|nr:ImmA/IrrE family metallo-endopeptidase [Tissierella praeacuta]